MAVAVDASRESTSTTEFGVRANPSTLCTAASPGGDLPKSHLLALAQIPDDSFTTHQPRRQPPRPILFQLRCRVFDIALIHGVGWSGPSGMDN